MSVEIYLAIASFITFVIFVLVLLKSRSGGDTKDDEEKEKPAARNRPAPVPRRNVQGRVRRRLQEQRQGRQEVAAAAARHSESSGDSDDQGANAEETDPFEGKMGAKKRKKMEEKAAKKAAREAEVQEREDRRQREGRQEELRRQKDEKEKEEELKQEELEKKRKEEQERKEQEEYEAMKAAFSVEEEGFEEKEGDEDAESQLHKFINHIKATKVVVLEDLASLFRLKTQEVIDRITTLEKEGTLTGVIDDRGKFIYIKDEELRAVAKFIRQRGRVSITELADASNSFINLTPDDTQLLEAAA